MNNSAIITVTPGQTLGLEVSSEAFAEKGRLLTLAKGQLIVNSTEEARYAADVLRELKVFTKQIEETRKEVKGPILALSKAIDAKAADLVADLEAQASRISRNLGAYEERQAHVRREAEERAREAARQIEEAAQARIDKAGGDEDRINKIQRKADAQVSEVRNEVAELAQLKPAGTTLRTNVKFEVTDINALHASNPFFVRMEPNTAAITAALRTADEGAVIPGLKWWKEAVVHAR